MTTSGTSLVSYVTQRGVVSLCAYNLASHARALCSWPKREKVLRVNDVPILYFGRTAKGQTIAWAPENPVDAGRALDGVTFSQEIDLHYYYDGSEDLVRRTHGVALGGGSLYFAQLANLKPPSHVAAGTWRIAIWVNVSVSGTSEYGAPISGIGELREAVVEVEIGDNAEANEGVDASVRVLPEIRVVEERTTIGGSPWYRRTSLIVINGVFARIEDC